MNPDQTWFLNTLLPKETLALVNEIKILPPQILDLIGREVADGNKITAVIRDKNETEVSLLQPFRNNYENLVRTEFRELHNRSITYSSNDLLVKVTAPIESHLT